MGLTDRGWGICWLVLACFIRPIEKLTIAALLLKSWLQTLQKPNRSALAVLLGRARRKTVRIWAEQSPFELKDDLKKRGYRWSDGADGRPRSWYIDVDEANEATEIEFLRTTVYLRDVELRAQAMNAINRFSSRS
jgi:DNA polymerase-3 subunit epsilon